MPAGHRHRFQRIVHEVFVPAIEAGCLTGAPPWPSKLRIHLLAGHGAVYSMTWSFSNPDGRATFHIDRSDPSDHILVWRRIGSHAIYERP